MATPGRVRNAGTARSRGSEGEVMKARFEIAGPKSETILRRPEGGRRSRAARRGLLAHAGVGVLQPLLPQLPAIALGLVDDERPVAQIFSLVELA